MTIYPENIRAGDWSLFLDRDGVINKRPFNDYVKRINDFEFLPGVFEALEIFDKLFSRIIVVTNQQGVGKGLMTKIVLDEIHQWMLQEIKRNNGRIDAVFYCTDLKSNKENCRKPTIIMAQQAQQKFPELDFEKSIMIGDTESDIQFGKNAGMKTILIGNENCSLIPDMQFNSLLDFALFIQKITVG
ncbi:MAG: HAD family hydrolase [Bacteroidales bacterium]|jgi:histidinol-phosphate phosphatase family protein|nr:HAD family hydrolase [Bacteroidales bacterium]